MAFNFSAQQFESAFEPKRLRNWEVTNKCITTTRKRSKFKESPKLADESIRKMSIQSEKSTGSDNKPASSILSSWEKRSSHIPLTNNWVEIDPTRSPRQIKEKADLSINDRLSNCKRTHPKPIQRSLSVQELTSAQKLANVESKGQPLLRNAYSNLVKAKNVKQNDQEHHTLADAVEWPANRKVSVDTTAVGYKVYQSPSATQCSKLKVFRPQTAAIVSSCEKENDRPKTTSRLHRRSIKSLNEMDLAIYWDVPPDEETAPACSEVEKKDSLTNEFSRPPTPKPICPHVLDDTNRPTIDKKSDLVTELPKLELIQNVPTSRSSEPSKRASNRRSATETQSPTRINVGVQVGKLDLRKVPQYCVESSSGKCTHTNAYKMAFKAGKPNNFNVNDALIERMAKSRNLRVPKPKTPFAKKNYAIRTLMPPFSIWPQTTGYDYPDHWRLASVYQHAYKPLEARKSPFMKTVFQ